MNGQAYSIDVTVDSFQQAVLDESFSRYVLIDFWADWCEPCKTLSPLLEKIVTSYQGTLVLAKVDCDVEQGIVGQFGVRSLPTVVLFKDGQPIDGFTGAQTESAIRQMLEKHLQLPTDSESEITQAQTLFQQGDTASAENLLKALLDKDNTDTPALILYARCLAIRGELSEAETILNSITADDHKQALLAAKAHIGFLKQVGVLPNLAELQNQFNEKPSDELYYQLAVAFVVHNEYEQAMKLLFELFKRNRAYQDDLPRKTLLQVFDLLGSDDELVTAYRRKLYQALY